MYLLQFLDLILCLQRFENYSLITLQLSLPAIFYHNFSQILTRHILKLKVQGTAYNLRVIKFCAKRLRHPLI